LTFRSSQDSLFYFFLLGLQKGNPFFSAFLLLRLTKKNLFSTRNKKCSQTLCPGSFVFVAPHSARTRGVFCLLFPDNLVPVMRGRILSLFTFCSASCAWVCFFPQLKSRGLLNPPIPPCLPYVWKDFLQGNNLFVSLPNSPSPHLDSPNTPSVFWPPHFCFF